MMLLYKNLKISVDCEQQTYTPCSCISDFLEQLCFSGSNSCLLPNVSYFRSLAKGAQLARILFLSWCRTGPETHSASCSPASTSSLNFSPYFIGQRKSHNQAQSQWSEDIRSIHRGASARAWNSYRERISSP